MARKAALWTMFVCGMDGEFRQDVEDVGLDRPAGQEEPVTISARTFAVLRSPSFVARRAVSVTSWTGVPTGRGISVTFV